MFDSMIPSISIGMPVYNCERYVALAIESIINQSFFDFELIISDNSSEDMTGDICKSYASKDPRIKYFRQSANIGMTPNLVFVIEQAQAKYFMFAAGDDTWSSNWVKDLLFVSKKYNCVAFGKVQYTDVGGYPIKSTANNINFIYIGTSWYRQWNYVFTSWSSGKMILLWSVFPLQQKREVIINWLRNSPPENGDTFWVYRMLELYDLRTVNNAFFYKRDHDLSGSALIAKNIISHKRPNIIVLLFEKYRNVFQCNLFFQFISLSKLDVKFLLILFSPIGYLHYLSQTISILFRYKIKNKYSLFSVISINKLFKMHNMRH
jgi:glycosyltransferase involved in cell wall biosynthesis